MPHAIIRGVVQGVALVVFTGAWLVFSCVLLLAFLLTLAIHGISALELAIFAGAWLAPTYFLSRRWRRGLSQLVRRV